MSQYVDIKKYTLDSYTESSNSSGNFAILRYSYHLIKDMKSMDSLYFTIGKTGIVQYYSLDNTGAFDNIGNIPSVDYNALNNEVDRLAKEKYGQNIGYTTEEPVLTLVDGRLYIKVGVSTQNYEYGELYGFLIPLA